MLIQWATDRTLQGPRVLDRASEGEGQSTGAEGQTAAGESEASAGAEGKTNTGGGVKPPLGKTADDGQRPGAGEASESGDGGSGGEGEKPGTEGEDTGPPEDGKYTFEMPDGMEIDETLAEALSPVMAELGLTNTQANALAKTYAEVTQQQADAQVKQWEQTNEQWLAAAKADKVIASLGWDTAIRHAESALEQFDPEGELSEAIGTGVVNGSHPALIRALARAGAALASDTTETSPAGGQAPDAPPEDRWYGKK